MFEIASILSRLWRLRRAMALVCAVALLGAIWTVFRFETHPPFLEKRSLNLGVATTEILVDARDAGLTDLSVDAGSLAARASIFARLADSPPVRASIERKASLEPG